MPGSANNNRATSKRAASRSGSPAKRAVAAKRTPAKRTPATPTTAREWKQKRGADLPVPSGNVALVRLLGPEVLMRKGSMPDSLLPIVEAAVREGKGMPPQKMAELASDPEKLDEILVLIDHVVVEAVIEPRVAPAPENEDDRRPDVLYVDEVEWEDKIFIFNFVVGGTRDLETFRKQQAAALASMGGQ
jgi:hypothetical protein